MMRPPPLSFAVWSLAVAFEARLQQELAPLGLSLAGFRLVGELLHAPEGLRTGELARRLGVKPPSVTTQVARLVEAGVVTLADAPGDARGTRVRLAKNAPLHEGLGVLERLDKRLGRGLSAAQRKALEATLHTMVSQLGAP
jgi:DNA-binding MarR family transcriptional regulator